MEKIPSGALDYRTIPIANDLELRVVQDDEADALFQLTDSNRHYLGEFLPWVDAVRQKADSLAHIKSSNMEWMDGTKYSFGIYSDNSMVGRISLMNLRSEKRPEIGYWIAQEYSGRRITSRAARAVEKFGFEELDVSEIIIRVRVDNVGSNSIAMKLGYELETTEVDTDDGEILNIWSKKNER